MLYLFLLFIIEFSIYYFIYYKMYTFLCSGCHVNDQTKMFWWTVENQWIDEINCLYDAKEEMVYFCLNI